MQIVFSGTGHPSGEVRIDGKFLMEIPGYGGMVGRRPSTTAKQSLCAAVLNLLRNLWRPQKFVMTVEQSVRVREIL
jgi:hypothetical protein